VAQRNQRYDQHDHRQGDEPREFPASQFAVGGHPNTASPSATSRRRRRSETTTFTSPCSMRTGSRSRGRVAGGDRTRPSRSKDEGLAWAVEAVFGGVPRYGAAEVGAFAVEGEKAAVGTPDQVEAARRKRRHRIGNERRNRAGNQDGLVLRRRSATAGTRERQRDPCRLGGGGEAEATPQPAENPPPGCRGPVRRAHDHGHPRAMPGPRKRAPMMVRTKNPTEARTTAAWSVSS
jgi:hypothetical protein